MSRKIKPIIIHENKILPANNEETGYETNWQKERDLAIQKRIIDIKPLTKNQERFLNAIYTSVITIATGPSGSGRSYLSCAAALKLFYEGKASKIILCRPQVTCGEYAGFLPGDEQSKSMPYLYPLIDAICQFIGDKEFDKLLKEEKIILATLGLMRGSSFRDSIFLLDEAENATYSQLKMALTRIGRNCIMVINGDYSQSDLQFEKRDFPKVIDKLSKLKDEISIIEFNNDDIVRSSIVRKIVEVLD